MNLAKLQWWKRLNKGDDMATRQRSESQPPIKLFESASFIGMQYAPRQVMMSAADWGNNPYQTYRIWLPWMVAVTSKAGDSFAVLVGSNHPVRSLTSPLSFIPLPHIYRSGSPCGLERGNIKAAVLKELTPEQRNIAVLSNYLSSRQRYFDCHDVDLPRELNPGLHGQGMSVTWVLDRWERLPKAEVLKIGWKEPYDTARTLEAASGYWGFGKMHWVNEEVPWE